MGSESTTLTTTPPPPPLLPQSHYYRSSKCHLSYSSLATLCDVLKPYTMKITLMTSHSFHLKTFLLLILRHTLKPVYRNANFVIVPEYFCIRFHKRLSEHVMHVFFWPKYHRHGLVMGSDFSLGRLFCILYIYTCCYL